MLADDAVFTAPQVSQERALVQALQNPLLSNSRLRRQYEHFALRDFSFSSYRSGYKSLKHALQYPSYPDCAAFFGRCLVLHQPAAGSERGAGPGDGVAVACEDEGVGTGAEANGSSM